MKVKSRKSCLSLLIFFFFSYSFSLSQIAIIPFKDNSGFKGKWDLETDVPNFLRAYIKEKFNISIVSPTVIKNYFNNKGKEIEDYNSFDLWKELSNEFKFRYLISGYIKTFGISKFTAGFPLMGGYESFSCIQEISFSIFDIEKEEKLYSNFVKSELSDNGLGVTLAGKPTKRNKEYNSFGDLQFGSEEFNQTIVGECMLKLASDFSSQVGKFIPLIKSGSHNVELIDTGTYVLKKKYLLGTILLREDKNVFIDLGSVDGILVEDTLAVFPPEHRFSFNENLPSLNNSKVTGHIEVKEIRGQHFSLCKILDGEDNIKNKFIVCKVTIR